MNAQQTEFFDKAILKVLDANRTRYGLSAAAISHMTVQFGFSNPDSEDVVDRLDYLIGKKFVEEVTKTIGKANRAWRITESGMQFIDEHP